MRGRPFSDTNDYITEAILMARYNQPYSEIKDMPLRTILFMLRLAEAEDFYQKKEMEKMKNKGRGRKL